MVLERGTELQDKLARQIGSYHMSVAIDNMVKAVIAVFSTTTGHIPKFRVRGGSVRENLALQNVQAWLPDGYSQIIRSYVFGPSGFWTMAPLPYAAKFAIWQLCSRSGRRHLHI